MQRCSPATTRWRRRGGSSIRSSRRGRRTPTRSRNTRRAPTGRPSRSRSCSMATSGDGSDAMPSVGEIEGVWSEQDTTPSAIDSALRQLLAEAHTKEHGYVPARVLNVIIVVDRQFKGEIANRLERVGRYHPSRTVLVAVGGGRATDDAPVPGGGEGGGGGLGRGTR